MNSGMDYRWNPDQLAEVFALPAVVVDKHIRLAGSAQLKVLLWLARAGRGRFDAADCAAAIGLSAADCADALQYWLETGVLTAPPAAQAGQQPAPAQAIPDEPDAPSGDAVKQAAPAPVTLMPAAPRAPAPRPAAVKPQIREVLARQKDSPEFAGLLDMASARLGRPLTHGDMATLCYLHGDAGLPAEVILMVLAYAVSAGKPHMRYVEKIALDWLDRGIDTIAAAEAHLCRLERRAQAWERVKGLLGIRQSPTIAQSDAAEQWVCDWAMPDDLIRLADEECVAKTGKFQCGYMGKILEHWRLDGIDTVEKARAQLGGAQRRQTKARQAADGSSLQTDEYEKNVMGYIPIYREG